MLRCLKMNPSKTIFTPLYRSFSTVLFVSLHQQMYFSLYGLKCTPSMELMKVFAWLRVIDSCLAKSQC